MCVKSEEVKNSGPLLRQQNCLECLCNGFPCKFTSANKLALVTYIYTHIIDHYSICHILLILRLMVMVMLMVIIAIIVIVIISIITMEEREERDEDDDGKDDDIDDHDDDDDDYDYGYV